MDWGIWIGQLTTTVGTVLVAWLALRTKIAELSKNTVDASADAAAARQSAEATEHSINNRGTPASDRWDEIHKDVKLIKKSHMGLAEDMSGVKETQITHGRDLRGIRSSQNDVQRNIGLLHQADRSIRADLTEHLEHTAETMEIVHRIVPVVRRLESRFEKN